MTLSYIFTGVETPRGIILRPLVPVTMWHTSDKLIDTNMLIDSGADFSMLPRDVAPSLGINISACEKSVTKGIGGRTNIAVSEINIRFGQRKEIHQLKIPIQIPLETDIDYPLLGREPFFRDFDVNFRMGYCVDKGKFVIEKVTKRHKSSAYPPTPIITRIKL